MDQELIIIASRITEMGIWKFYLLSIGLLTVFILNVLEKEKGFINKLATLSSGVLFLITIILTLISQFIQ